MKKFLFIIVVFLMAACSDNESTVFIPSEAPVFSPSVYKLDNTSFQIINANYTNVIMKCENPTRHSYSVSLKLDDTVSKFVFYPEVGYIDTNTEFSTVKIVSVSEDISGM